MATRRDILRKAGLASSLVAIPALGGLVATRADASVRPDPVFAAIEKHRSLWQRANAIRGTREQEDAASEAELAALHELMRTRPTTIPGLLAFLDHLDTEAGFGDCAPSEEDYDAVVAAVRAVIRGGAS